MVWEDWLVEWGTLLSRQGRVNKSSTEDLAAKSYALWPVLSKHTTQHLNDPLTHRQAHPARCSAYQLKQEDRHPVWL